jgi:alkyl hydroperoxide reductase subunit AhpC/predicted Ser/Thr protein kinase
MKRVEPRSTCEVGIDAPAPPFSLDTIDSAGKETRRSLSAYANKWLMLLFYPRDFSFVCPTEINAFSGRYDELAARSCDVLGISIDSLTDHAEWLRTPVAQGGVAGLRFPLGTDTDGEVSKAYGLWHDGHELPHRGLFLIDPDGKVRYSLQHGGSVGRSVDETLRVLDALQSGGLCPASWTLGDGTLDVRSLLQPGRVLGHYRIESELGVGAFASVFRAKDLRLERSVAIKVLRDLDAASRDLLMDEARASASIQHPNVCPVYAVEDADGLSLIAMEYLSGPPLSEYAANKKLSLASVLALGAPIARGLAAAHKIGLAHGDLKPANVIVPSSSRPVVVDFGLAAAYRRAKDGRQPKVEKPVDADAATQVYTQPAQPGGSESSRRLAGTPAYMSPEQAAGEPPNTSSDVFALGLLLFELYTGRRMLSAPSIVPLLEGLRRGEYLESLPALDSSELRTLLEHLLSPNPEHRPSAAEVASTLEA